MRKYEFGLLRDPVVGAGLGKYCNWQIKSYGREIFRDAVQTLACDLPIDPWGVADLDELPPEDGWESGEWQDVDPEDDL